MIKKPKHYYSWTTLIGAAIASISFFLIIFLFLLSLFIDEGSQYTGLVIFIVLPAFFVFGLLLIPLGIFLKRKKERKENTDRKHRFPIVNLNDPSQRWVVFFVTISTFVFLILSILGGYEAIHYTESNEFCGTLCHTVMNPEYATYHESSHARVQCVECHVGSGAEWYIKSKFSGMYQVYSILFDKYPTPIPTPLHNLRPASETCEQCHWPEKFYGQKYDIHKHYIADEENTEWDIHLLMKTNNEHRVDGFMGGIHWHINSDVKIEYAPLSHKRDTVLVVKYTNLKNNEVTIFVDDSVPVNQSQMDTLEFRKMDCLDCHNRPAHNFKPPRIFFDDAITNGIIPQSLPDIKVAAMDILKNDYPTLDSANKAIEMGINEYYEFMYEEIYDTNKKVIDDVVISIQELYAANVFPEMKARWTAYPNHLGHLETNGCYRCHNGKFKSEQGEVISRDCKLCHSIMAQGTPGNMQFSNGEVPLDFVHPINIKGKWQRIMCSECHDNLYE